MLQCADSQPVTATRSFSVVVGLSEVSTVSLFFNAWLVGGLYVVGSQGGRCCRQMLRERYLLSGAADAADQMSSLKRWMSHISLWSVDTTPLQAAKTSSLLMVLLSVKINSLEWITQHN